MEIQIMLIETKFYRANVYFTLLCAQVQCGSKGVGNVLFICKMFWGICGLEYFKTAAWRDSYIWKQYYLCTACRKQGEKEECVKASSQPLRVGLLILLEEGRSVAELPPGDGGEGAKGDGCGPATLCRPGPSQLRQKPAAGKVKDVAMELIVFSVSWDYLELRSINQNRLW